MAVEKEYSEDEILVIMKDMAKRIHEWVVEEKKVPWILSLREIPRWYVNFKFKIFAKEIVGYEICCEEIEPYCRLFGRDRLWRYCDVPLCRLTHSGENILVESFDSVFDEIAEIESRNLCNKTQGELKIAE